MSVDDFHNAYDEHNELWKRARHASFGQSAIKAQTETYLPRLSGQSDGDYSAYLDRAHWFGATGRTVDGLRGMIFRVPPIKEAPNAMDDFFKDVTQTGVSFEDFAEELAGEILEVARAGILVDFPMGPTGQQTQAEAERAGLRPFWRLLKAEAIRNWRTESINNRRVVTEVRLDDVDTFEGDEFQTFEIPVIRVLDLDPETGFYRQRLFVENEQTGEWDQMGEDIVPIMGSKPLSFIPFVFLSHRDTTPDVRKPPLCDLVDTNISHYQLNADYRHGLHFAALPTPWVAGAKTEEEPGTIGPTEVWLFEDSNAKAGMLEFTGAGLERVRIALEDLKGEMAVLGARMLAPEKRAVEAAETAQIHRAGEQSVLAATANTESMGLTKAAEIARDWMGLEDDVGISLNTDFMPTPMTPAEMRELFNLLQGGGMAWKDYVRKLKEGEVIAQDRNADDIKAEIETEGLMGPGLRLVDEDN